MAHIYEVGEIADEIFVAMEYIKGRTLAEWMAEVGAPRPWREVLAVFSEAGRGLAAAHAAGLVHRDFKPGNVMIGDDGRARVMDFGLARTGDDTIAYQGSTYQAVSERTSKGAEGWSTHTGTTMGTPAYMSPEQFVDARVDARSDQFSFCVALYEALYGERPFAGDSPGALIIALDDEAIREPPPGAAVPLWLRRLLLRGLARDPAERWPSMRALLTTLEEYQGSLGDPSVLLPWSKRLAWLALGMLVLSLFTVHVTGSQSMGVLVGDLIFPSLLLSVVPGLVACALILQARHANPSLGVLALLGGLAALTAVFSNYANVVSAWLGFASNDSMVKWEDFGLGMHLQMMASLCVLVISALHLAAAAGLFERVASLRAWRPPRALIISLIALVVLIAGAVIVGHILAPPEGLWIE